MNYTAQQQTFFLPGEVSRQSAVIHSSCFNLAQNLLHRSEFPYVLIEIPGMHYLAMIEAKDIWFIDTEKYIHNKDRSGQPVTISWHPHLAEARNNQDQHIPMDVVYYGADLAAEQQRLTVEFYKALMLMDEKYRLMDIPAEAADIVPLQK